MSQNDLLIDNQSFPATRSDINSALQALGSNNSGLFAPSTTYANMTWYDTGQNILKIRSEADDAWIPLMYLHQSLNVSSIINDTHVVTTVGNSVGRLGDQNTGTWQAGTGTTESLVSPAKVRAAVLALTPPETLQKFIPTTTWEVNYDPRTGPTTISSDNITLPAGFYIVTLTISMRFFAAPSGENYSTSYEMRHIKNGSTVVLKSGGPSVALEDTTQVYSLTDQLFEFGGNDYFQTYEPDSSDNDHDDTTTTITVTAKGPYSNASYLV